RIVGAFLMLTIFIFSHAAPLPVFRPLDSYAKTNISDERRLLAPWVPILSWCHTSHPQTGAGDGPRIDDFVSYVHDFVKDVMRPLPTKSFSRPRQGRIRRRSPLYR